MDKTKKSPIKEKESRWTGSVFILGDKHERPTKHTFIIKTSGNKKTLTVLNQHNEVWNKKEGWGKELAEKYPVFIEDKPFKGFKAFTPNSVLNNVMNLEKISIFITMRGSHQGGPRHSYKEQLVCSMMSSKDVASLKRFLSKHSKSKKKTKKGGLGSSSSSDAELAAAYYAPRANKTQKRKRSSPSPGTPWSERSPDENEPNPKMRDMVVMDENPWKNLPTIKVRKRDRKKKTVLRVGKFPQPKPRRSNKKTNKGASPGNVSANKPIFSNTVFKPYIS